MRKFNVQVAAALFTIFIVLGSGFYVAHKHQSAQRVRIHAPGGPLGGASGASREAREPQQARQDYVSASKCLKAYVYLMPYDVDGRWKSAPC